MTDLANRRGIAPILLIVGPIAGAIVGMFGIGGSALAGQDFPGLLPMSVGDFDMPAAIIFSCAIFAFVHGGSGQRMSCRAF